MAKTLDFIFRAQEESLEGFKEGRDVILFTLRTMITMTGSAFWNVLVFARLPFCFKALLRALTCMKVYPPLILRSWVRQIWFDYVTPWRCHNIFLRLTLIFAGLQVVSKRFWRAQRPIVNLANCWCSVNEPAPWFLFSTLVPTQYQRVNDEH